MPSHPQLQDETVEALLDSTWKLVNEEIRIGDALQNRASGLAGFAGIIISLAASAGKIGDASKLSSGERTVVLAAFGLGLTLLVATTLVAILLVLRPRPIWKIGMREIERFPLPEFVYERKVIAQGRILRGLVETLAAQRNLNYHFGRWLLRSYMLLAGGLICIAVEALMLGVGTAT